MQNNNKEKRKALIAALNTAMISGDEVRIEADYSHIFMVVVVEIDDKKITIELLSSARKGKIILRTMKIEDITSISIKSAQGSWAYAWHQLINEK